MNNETCHPATRWKIAAASVLIDLCIGSVYAWSVYKLPLQKLYHWSDLQISATFSVAIAVLGLSAAFGGGWMERNGPRKSAMVAAVFFGTGIMGAGLASHMGSLWMLYLTYGVIGGIGLGLGYISPVSTLLKWFPDRRGLATGMAVFGFGAGALITAPIAAKLIETFGVSATFTILGVIYLAVMLLAATMMRFPPSGYVPAGWNPDKLSSKGYRTTNHFELAEALRTPQFWLLWGMFFLNITAGIMLIGHASPMAQEILGLNVAQAGVIVGLMGIFNGAGRIFWATASDYLGRATTFAILFMLQIVLFAAFPHLRTALLFQACLFTVLTCYGGGFATVPAFIADMFGSQRAGAIYGVILTAWSMAGICGPILAAVLHEKTGGYSAAMYAISGALAVALLFTAAISLMLRKASQPDKKPSEEVLV